MAAAVNLLMNDMAFIQGEPKYARASLSIEAYCGSCSEIRQALLFVR